MHAALALTGGGGKNANMRILRYLLFGDLGGKHRGLFTKYR